MYQTDTRVDTLDTAARTALKGLAMRFFLIDGVDPAFEPEPGKMLAPDDEGVWGPVVPREVLADPRSPEVSKDRFVARVASMGVKLPQGVAPPTEER